MNTCSVTLICFAVVLVVLQGCGSATKKPTEPVSVLQTIELGNSAFKRWQQQKNVDALIEAEAHYRSASDVLPDNINLQKTYYSSLYILSILDWPRWHEKLEQHFNTVNILIKPDLSPPQIPQFNYLMQHNASLHQQIALLKKAVKTQPESARAWYILSIKLEDDLQMDLALDAALRAAALEQNTAEFVFHAGDLYNDLASSRGCIYDAPSLAKKSVQYLAKAVAIDPGNQQYQDRLATLYSHLGLYPLALQVAIKSRDIDDNQLSAQTLGEAYLGMHQRTKADEQFQKLVANYQQWWANELRAVIAVNNNQWQEAQQLLVLSVKTHGPDLFNDLLKNWIDVINQPQEKRQVSILAKPENDWESSLKAFINQQGDTYSLIEHSSNTCEATQAYFYTAMKLWIEDNAMASKKQLEEVLRLRAYGFNEYLWARALLNSNLFD